MTTLRILPGLPPYGPMALCFPVRMRSGGARIEFSTSVEDRWVGNFARGFGDLDDVRTELGDRTIIVVASGAGYVVDAHARQLVRELNGPVSGIWFTADLDAMIVSNGLWFEALSASRILWRSLRISWEGIRDLEFSALTLYGEAYSPLSDEWQRFEVKLENGEAIGGSYNWAADVVLLSPSETERTFLKIFAKAPLPVLYRLGGSRRVVQMSVIATPRRGHGWTAFLAAIRLLRFESPAPQISAFAGVRLKF